MHLRQEGARERDTELRVDDLMQRCEFERADVKFAVLLGARRPPQLVQKRALESGAARDQDADVLASESTRRVGECGRSRGVEPLHVIDRNEQLTIARERSQCVEKRDPGRMCVRRRPLDLLEDERSRERRALSNRKRRERLVEDTVEKVAETGEAESHLALGGFRLQDTQPGSFGRFDPGPPERRLAHSRLALEH